MVTVPTMRVIKARMKTIPARSSASKNRAPLLLRLDEQQLESVFRDGGNDP